MNERETERRLLDWLDVQASPAVPDNLRRSVAAIPMTVPMTFSERLAAAVGLRPLAYVPSVAWILVLTGLLLAVVAGGLVAGGFRLDRPFDPTPQTVPALTVVDEASDILATTHAKPLPAQATCPSGTDPDAIGSADQDRPAGGPMAFDRHAGRIVLLDGTQTWTYDVCANTWQRMRAAGPPAADRLVYDADSDRTLAFARGGDDSLAPATTPAPSVAAEGGDPAGTAAVDEPSPSQAEQGEPDGEPAEASRDARVIWSYDLAADRWTKVASVPWPRMDLTYGTTFYHDPSGLVVVHDGAAMWAYDVEANSLARVRQQPDPTRPVGSGLPVGKIAFGYDPVQDLVVAVVVPGAPEIDTIPGVPTSPWGETWTFDPGSGSWRLEAAPSPSDLIVCYYWRASTDCLPTNGRAVFDEASGLAVFFNRDNGGAASAHATPGRIDVYDAGQHAWRTLRSPIDDGATPNWCQSMPPVYDPLNRRIVCLSSADEPIGTGPTYPFAGVWSFSTATGESRWLLQPDTTRCDVATLAGKPGETGASDGAGTAARFSEPRSIVMDSAGAFYITDTGNHTIRKMAPDGTVTTFAGRPDEPGNADGAGPQARFSRPSGIAINVAGDLYVADTDNDAVRRISPDGSVTTLAEDLGISPVGIAVNAGGTVYTGGREGNVILAIAPTGTVTTIAGVRGQAGWTDGTGAGARVGSLLDIKVRGSDEFLVIDEASDGNQAALRTVGLVQGGSDATVTTEPGDWPSAGRPGVVWPDPYDTIVITSSIDDTVVEMRWNWELTAHPVMLLAGRQGEAGYQDGRGDAARFRDPTGIVRDGAGLLYIVDSGNSVIRTMTCTP